MIEIIKSCLNVFSSEFTFYNKIKDDYHTLLTINDDKYNYYFKNFNTKEFLGAQLYFILENKNPSKEDIFPWIQIFTTFCKKSNSPYKEHFTLDKMIPLFYHERKFNIYDMIYFYKFLKDNAKEKRLFNHCNIYNCGIFLMLVNPTIEFVGDYNLYKNKVMMELLRYISYMKLTNIETIFYQNNKLIFNSVCAIENYDYKNNDEFQGWYLLNVIYWYIIISTLHFVYRSSKENNNFSKYTQELNILKNMLNSFFVSYEKQEEY